ncbi:MAG: phosphopantetheine adenylyltransferase [Candidatus Heimdallarchaeaceae archaeon]
MPWLNEVLVGGTFDHLHEGHKALLEAALSFGSYVRVGVTSDHFAKRMRRSDPYIHLLQPFEVRKNSVMKFLESRGCKKFEVMKLEDRYGPALNSPTAEGIVVTEETYPTAVDINKLRAINGLDQLLVLVIPFVYDEKGIIISSRRIRQQLATKSNK